MKENYEQQLKQVQKKQEAYHQAYENRKDVEQKFSTIAKLNGGDGTSYQTAKAFEDVQIHNETLRRQATYRNFDSSPAAGILSPEAKAQLYKDRAVATGLKTAIKPVTMTFGAVAAAAGGSQASMMGAMAGSMVVDKVENVVGQGADYYRAKGAYDYSDGKEDTEEKNGGQREATPAVTEKKPAGNVVPQKKTQMSVKKDYSMFSEVDQRLDATSEALDQLLNKKF